MDARPAEEEDLLPPPAKRRSGDVTNQGRLQNSGTPWSRHQMTKPIPPSNQSPSVPGTKSEFPLRSLEDFYKACPSYRLPVEIGSFSLDEKGKQHLDRSQLRFFSPPAPSIRLHLDLRVGYGKYTPVEKSVPSDKLNPVLRWIAANGDCFQPKMSSQKSLEKRASIDSEVGSAAGVSANGDMGRRENQDIPSPIHSNRNAR